MNEEGFATPAELERWAGSGRTAKPCCTAAHNLDIVRDELHKVLRERDDLRTRVAELERFQKLVWVLVEARSGA